MTSSGMRHATRSLVCLAMACVFGMVGASTAMAFQDRALEWVPPLGYGPNSDTCYHGDSYEFTVVWRECESAANWPQWHDWKEGKVTNDLNTYGTALVGVTHGETLSDRKSVV